MPKSRILVVDDEAAIRDSLRMTLEYEGYEFIGAATGQEGLALVEREAPDLVLLDVKMPGMDGLEVLDRLRSMNETLPIVVISGLGATLLGAVVLALTRSPSPRRLRDAWHPVHRFRSTRPRRVAGGAIRAHRIGSRLPRPGHPSRRGSERPKGRSSRPGGAAFGDYHHWHD